MLILPWEERRRRREIVVDWVVIAGMCAVILWAWVR